MNNPNILLRMVLGELLASDMPLLQRILLTAAIGLNMLGLIAGVLSIAIGLWRLYG